MFGLSKREILVKMVRNCVESQLPKYRVGTEEVFSKYTIEELNDDSNNSQLEGEMSQVRIEYLQSVFNAVKNAVEAGSINIAMRLDFALMTPRISGLPDEIDIGYFARNGISAGDVYALLFYAMMNKPITRKDYQICSELSHYQVGLMNDTLANTAEKMFGLKE
jgi:hypothetical protein